MASSGQDMSHGRWLIPIVAVGILLSVGGACNLFGQSNTEDNAEKALNDLQIDITVPEANIPIPEIYKTPPKIVEQMVGGKPEFKLFYFCRHHSSNEIRQIVHEQFATKLFDKKGKETKLVDYTVSSNPATNQIIVRCPAREDVDAVLELLEAVDVPPIQVKIDCLISEVYADFTFDRETTIAIDNLFGEDIAMKPGGTSFGADVQQLIVDDEFLPAFPGASLRELIRARMGLKIGYLSAAHGLTALVDLLESRGYLKILMNPTLEIVNGKTAVVKSTQHVPLQKITKLLPGSGGELTTVVTENEYVDVIDSLEVTPHVFSDGYIGLETNILLGAKNTPDGVKQVPILTKKEIESKENRVRPGESLIIGGIRKNEEFGVVRGVPLLKDIPLLGFLFSGEDTERRAVETIFILTPTYSTGGRPTREVMEDIRKTHESAPTESLQETIDDIFGDRADHEEQEQKIHEAEQLQLEAKAEKEEARSAVRDASAKVERVTAEAQKATIEAQKATIEAQKATADAEKTKADAEKLMAQAKELLVQAQTQSKNANEAKAAADKAIADAKKAQAQAVKAKAQADEKTKTAEKVIREAEQEKIKAAEQQAKAQEDKKDEAKAKAEDVQVQAAKAKAAEKIIKEAEQEKAKAAKKQIKAQEDKKDQTKAKAEGALARTAKKEAQAGEKTKTAGKIVEEAQQKKTKEVKQQAKAEEDKKDQPEAKAGEAPKDAPKAKAEDKDAEPAT